MEICIKEWPVARNHYGSTEDTEGTDGWELDGIILGSLRLEILEEIFNNKIWPGARNNLSLK